MNRRRDHDDDEHADGDAENRQRGAHVVRLDRIERDADALEKAGEPDAEASTSGLLPHGGDRIEQRRAARRIDAGDHADAGADADADEDRPDLDGGRQR